MKRFVIYFSEGKNLNAAVWITEQINDYMIMSIVRSKPYAKEKKNLWDFLNKWNNHGFIKVLSNK